jgi:hypothetical protein
MIEDVAHVMKSSTVAGPTSDQMIEDAEKALGIRFSPSYREFLSSYGAALCGTFEIAGVFRSSDPDEPPLWTDVVGFSQQMRRASRGRIPPEYVAISDDGGDYTFYLDGTSPRVGGEYPVVVLGPGTDCVVVADSFPDFVIRSYHGVLSF